MVFNIQIFFFQKENIIDLKLDIKEMVYEALLDIYFCYSKFIVSHYLCVATL